MSIGDDHRAFARAVVAAAREHGMDHTVLTFRRSVAKHIGTAGGPDVFEEISMTWHSGRHDAAGTIRLEGKAIQTIGEQP